MSKLAPPIRPTRDLPPGRITFEEFLTRDGDPHVEWVDGEVVSMPPVTDGHAEVTLFLVCLLKMFVDMRELGVVRNEPFQMHTGPDLPSRTPDVLFVANRNRKRIQRLCVEGPADLVVEVISPESRSRNRGEKFHEYEQGGVRESWLIDPQRRQAEFYVRGRNGIYELIEADDGGVYHSTAIARLRLKLDWLWQYPCPPVADVLKALCVM